jgi:isopentenyl diphosphate isomerase/L-lactate dehydrogenase-like FMN-dependent dehydrogenase
MMQTEGERAGAAAAAAAGIPFALSTMGTTSIEDVAAAAPGGRNWFQLYMWKDRDRSMVGRAYLYGLMAGGRAGVDRMIAILRSEIERTMRLLGATSLDELAPHHVTLPGH